MRRAVVVIGGPHPEPKDPEARSELFDSASVVIAADSGLHLVNRLGRRADVVVGDMDSVDPDELARASRAGTEVIVHPRDKDQTDFELALAEVSGRGCDSAVVLGSPGGRLDHLIAATATLCSTRFADLALEAWWGDTHVVAVHRCAQLRGTPGQTVSLIATNGDALGVTTTGLQWPLNDETLHAGSSRGVSNTFVGDKASVRVDAGTLAAIIDSPTGEQVRNQ